MRTRSRGRSFLAVLFAGALVLGACGRDDGDETATTEPDDPSGTTETTDGEPGELTAGPGFDGETIRLGVITPETGIAAAIGGPLTAGNQVYWDSINAEGGVAGEYEVELVVRDSEYIPDTGVQQYNGIKDDVVMFQQVLGTPVTEALVPLLEDDEILAGPASLDAFWVRDPYLMPIGAPYQIQAINALSYAVDNLDAEDATLCSVTKDDDYGQTGLDGLEFGADAFGLDIDVSVEFRQGDQVFSSQIEALMGADCDIVWITALPTETIPILTEAVTRDFAPTWLGQSPTWVNALGGSDLAPYLEENFLLLSEGPQWGDDSVEGMAQMLADIEEYAPDQAPDIYFAFGYAQAWAAHQILEEAVSRGDLSPTGVLEASTTVGTLTFGGLLGDYVYGPAEDRDPPRESSIFAIDTSVEGFLSALEVNFTSEPAEDYEFDD
ncbi:MAG: ABC transporter substrate-binding protein [Acidimicrobiia bacterium]|nr:ABC transporter substrate-binding protein [Acidimicrobiia bacterium]